MNPTSALNRAWMISCAREDAAFRRATRSVRRTQRNVLSKIIRANRKTWYGTKFGFDAIGSIADFQSRVPIVDYGALEPQVTRIAEGEASVLTRDPVVVLEPTGGSSQANKLIPYTSQLRREFQRAISAWVHDVMRAIPAVRRGRSYWSISPIVDRETHSVGGIPIGFQDDRDYLSHWQRWAVSRLLVMPPNVGRLKSFEQAKYLTLLHLLSAADLSLISVWSPTFLTSLFSELPKYWEAICEDLRRGEVHLPYSRDDPTPPRMTLPTQGRRSDELARLFRSADTPSDALAEVWPSLALVSCWGDAASANYLPHLKRQLPQAAFQPKGLLATEGVVSIPRTMVDGSVLALRSHFLEFAELDCGDKFKTPLLADELELGGQYRVLMTTGGGLYRYDLGDDVEVVGFDQSCPSIRLLGRGNQVSDLVGEKLHEQFVSRAIGAACEQLRMQATFAMLAPVDDVPPHYRLYLEVDRDNDRVSSCQIANALEKVLHANPHYQLAVEAGQLSPLDVCLVRGDACSRYQAACIERGQKLGDIKPIALDNNCQWDQVFQVSGVSETQGN